jgi:hypothetical protein
MRSQLRFHLAVLAFAAVLVSCGGGAASPDVASDAETTTTEASAQTTPDVEDLLPVAPDFTLTLQPEGEFTLSEAGKPVYMIFWAEW